MSEEIYYDASKAEELIRDVLPILRDTDGPIDAVNWYADDASSPGLQAARREYFDALLSRRYRRVLQTTAELASGPVPLDALAGGYDDLYVEHFRRMIAQRDGAGGIELRIAPPRLPMTFVVLGESAVVLELNEIQWRSEGRMSKWQTRGALLIKEPPRGVIEGFRRMFADLFDRAQPVTHAARV